MPDTTLRSSEDARGRAATPQVFATLPLLLEHLGRTSPDRAALLAPEGRTIPYGALLNWVQQSTDRLRRLGIGRTGRVAVIAPIGLDAALATLAAASAAICVPLNPALKADEWRRYFAELDLTAVLTCLPANHPGPAAAAALGIPVIQLVDDTLKLLTARPRRPARTRPATGADDALVLLTSGTTSRPKLVPLTHASICRSGANAAASLGLGAQDRLLHMLPLYHAHGLLSGLLAALAVGSSVVCTAGFDADRLFGWLTAFEPTWYTAVPTIHRLVLTAATRQPQEAGSCSLRLIRSASSSLPADLLQGLETAFGVPVVETYGMTEAASQIAANPLSARKPNSVGTSAGAEIAIRDATGRWLPAGEHGEIVLRGPTLTQCYANDAAATAASFRDGWFHTGDLGYLDAEGYLFILGRLRDIIDRGGQKIAPAEVEQVLLRSKAVAEVAAFPMPHRRLGEQVAAAVVLHPGATTDARSLQAFARLHLAEYKVPARIAFVPQIPKTPAGKVNRSGLAAALGLVDSGIETVQSPRSECEAGLAALWSEILQVDPIGVDQDIFALGAESLAAVQMLSRLRLQFGVDLTLEDLLNAPTVAELAVRVQSAPRLLPPTTQTRNRPKARTSPLSFQQLRMQVLTRIDPIGSVYHVLDVIRLAGPLDVDALQLSLDRLLSRHEILRSKFPHRLGEPFQAPGPPCLVLDHIEAKPLPPPATARLIRQHALDLVHSPFNLETGPPLRARLVRLANNDHALIVALHHIVTDGWSQSLFWHELQTLYAAATNGIPAALTPARLQYRDYVAWQRNWLETAAAEEQRAYWRRQLDGLSELPLPTDRRPPPQRSGRGARHPLRLSRPLTQRLKAFSRAHRVTLFMTILAAFQSVLHRHAGQDDVAVGSLLASRNRMEFESLLGMLVNTVILRTDVSGDPTVQDLLHRVRDVTLAAHRHGDLPIEIVHQVIRLAPGADRHAPFRSMLILQKAERRAPSLPGLALERIDIDPGTAHQDLVLELREQNEWLDGWLEYSTDLFNRPTIARLAGHLRAALESMIAHPEQRVSQLILSPRPERRLMLERWSQGPIDPGHRGPGFVQRFLAQADATPGAIAVSAGQHRWTYRRLANRSRALAGRLAAEQVGPETIVVLLSERTPDLLAALIAVQWLGAAFLLLDPTHPPARLADMIHRSAAPIVLTTATLAPALLRPGIKLLSLAAKPAKDGPDPRPPLRPAPSSLAYVVYTSGSTGAPKGAMIEQRGLLNHLLSKLRDLPLTPYDVVAQTAPQSFDIAIWQFLAPLMAGARVHICGSTPLQDPAALLREIEQEAVTVLQLVPALLAGLLELRAGGLDRLRVLLVTGEAVAPDLLRSWFQQFPAIPVINAYGPAECADDVATHRMTVAPTPHRPVPIGRPIANTRVYILDAVGNPAPAGIPGELQIGGAGVGRGYLGDPDQTAERFHADPFVAEPGARLYRTGDLARWRTDGTLEFLGRIDDQIKLRGHRIEPGEIERTLLAHPDISAATVLLYQEGGHEARLAAFFVAAPLRQPSIEALRDALKRQLPAIMIPALFIRLDRMPLTANGKLDRRALQASAARSEDWDHCDIPPRTPTEHTVAAIWRELFGTKHVGARANFFDLGGHSLLAGKVLARLARDCGRAPSLRAFFAAPTVEGLARAIDALDPADPPPPVAAMYDPQSGTGLPSIAQEDVLRSEWAFPGLPQFNLPFAYRLRGKLDLAALTQSIAALIARHESLRTGFTYRDDGSGALVAAPETLPLPFTTQDLAAGIAPITPETKRLLLEKARLVANETGWIAFDLAQPPLLRFHLLRLDADDHVLVMVLHHVIVDGWSIGILMEELNTLYAERTAGRTSPLPPPPPFSSFARWQRASSTTPVAEKQFAYWRKRLRGATPMFRTDCTSSAILADPVEHAPLDLPAKLTNALAALGRAEGVTLFTTLLTAFKALLMARSARTDLCVATAMANRSALWTEPMVGVLENTTVLRSRIEHRLCFPAALHRVSLATTEAFEHQHLPFETLARRLEQETGLSPASLAQATFIMRDAAPTPLCLPGVTVAPFGDSYRQGQPVFPLDRTWISLSLKPIRSGIIGTCGAKVGLLGADAANRWATDYKALLHRIVVNPGARLGDLIEL